MSDSKCFQKYGNEWSRSLTEMTKEHMKGIGTGYVKHITGIWGRIAFTRSAFGSDFGKQTKLIPESELSNEVFIVALPDSRPLYKATGPVFDCAYPSVQDMIDDGWALD